MRRLQQKWCSIAVSSALVAMVGATQAATVETAAVAKSDSPALKAFESTGRMPYIVGFRDGKAFYRNRIIRTEAFDAEQQAGESLWPGLAEHFPVAAVQPEVEEVKKRLLYSQALETARCMEEGVLRTAIDGDLGSILGWGFAPFHGGTLQFVNAMGAPAFVRRARELAERFGPRFEPAAVIVRQAEAGGRFEDV
jgi:hypothetical protein